TRTDCPFEPQRRTVNRQRCGVAVRIHLLHGWNEQGIDSGNSRNLGILDLAARIRREIGWIAELSRVHEDRRDHVTGAVARGAKQRDMAVVERAHRWNQTDPVMVV